MLRLVIILCLVGLMAPPMYCQVIGNNELSQVESLPQSFMDCIGNQRWLFTHASVGGNMVEGMKALHSFNPTRYKLTISSTGFDSSSGCATPSSQITPGTVIECDRGNPGWEQKYTIFENSIFNAGWHDNVVDVCMDKLCYIDNGADANTYISKMSALEARYPNTRFVFTTMPITTSADNDNIQRNQYNQSVRTYCASNGRLLFDIADMEAHDPNGAESTFSSGGSNYQSMYSGYSDDGGHLNQTGQQHIALGWYAVAAAIASNTTPNTTGTSPITTSSPNTNTTTAWSKLAIGGSVVLIVAVIGLVCVLVKTSSTTRIRK
jgi:hypothetical protein